MKYTKKQGVSGMWVKKDEIENGTKVKIVSETEPKEGEFGLQNVSKLRFQGAEDSVNANLNNATINGLIDAFGEDSKDWIGKILTFQKEKMNVGGKRVTAMYLIPEGYELGEDAGGYIVIMPKEKKVEKVVNEDEIDIEGVPF